MFRHVYLAPTFVLLWQCFYCATSSLIGAAVPTGWDGMCRTNESSNIMKQYLPEVNPQESVIYMICRVTAGLGVRFQFSTLREHLNKTGNISVFVHVECENGSKISMPWPMKAKGVVGVSINNCILTDKYADFWNPQISHVKSGLRVLEIRHSNWLSDTTSFNKMKSGLSNITQDYDCGQASTLEYMVTTNVSDILDPKELRSQYSGHDGSFKDTNNQWAPGFKEADVNFGMQPDNPFTHRLATATVTSENADIFAQLARVNIHKCNFSKLRILEESYPSLMIVNYFKLLVRTNNYPELRVLNFSRCGIRDMPNELVNYRRHFPKLTYIDLSWNNMSEVTLPLHTSSIQPLVLNVSYNNITRLTFSDLNALSQFDGLFLDIRGNPIHCGCHMAELLLKMKTPDFFTEKLRPYSYIRDVECASPFNLIGRRLSSLVVLLSPVDVRCNIDRWNQTSSQNSFLTTRLFATLMCTTTTGQYCYVL